ncbi:MAG TPA: trypsin-like peptidase domain-containing protein [Vicinamibacterales bacterium]|jgi:serine protease Do|nr:trypsin-like peptidase domain-containing protein [Vicinamibacterales bacterium]
MSTKKTTLFYTVLIVIASIAVGMVIASRLDMSSSSSAQTVSLPPANSAPLAGPVDAATFRNIAKAQSPAVVNIRTEARRRTRELTEFFGGDDFMERFFGGGRAQPGPDTRRRQPPEQFSEGAGTGFIVDKDGFILTNNHVVEGADRIRVALFNSNGDIYDAKVVGRDPITDSALIQLSEKPSEALPVVKFGDSDQLQPGDWVMAIGNPFNLSHTVTVGVVSALGRQVPGSGVAQREQPMIQTDAAINPGNSGGPLLNVRGEVVGINTAIFTDQRSANIGIGFATPINLVRELLPQLRTGKITRGRIGVQVNSRQFTESQARALGLPRREGALITTVTKAGPADSAGLKPGDVIMEYNGKPVKDSSDLVNQVVRTKPGTTVPLKVVRKGQTQSLNVTVEELDLDEEQGARTTEEPESTEETIETGFGMELTPLSAEAIRRFRLPSDLSGALVTSVDRGSAAEAGNVVEGDIILQVNTRPVSSATDVRRELQSIRSGDTASLLVWRRGRTGDGQEVFLTITKP